MATAAVRRGWKNESARENLVRANEHWNVDVQTDLDTVLSAFTKSRQTGTDGANHPTSAKTIFEYEYDIKKFFAHLRSNGVTTWQAITRQQVADYVAGFRARVEAKELSDSSMWKPMRSLRALFYFVEKQQQFDLESFRSALPKIPVNPRRLWIPTPAEMKQFMDSINQKTVWGFRDYVISTLLLDCGARIGEVCNLTEKDIFWESGMVRLYGKKRSAGRQVERLVSVSLEKTIPLLKEWQRQAKKFTKTERFFCTRFGGPLQPNAMNHEFTKLRVAAGMNDGDEVITPHTFRHFFCTHYLVNGGSLHNLKQITGHEDLSTLMIYVHMANELSYVKEEHRRVSPLESLMKSAPAKQKRKMY